MSAHTVIAPVIPAAAQRPQGIPMQAARTGMVLALAGIGMLFIAFTSAFVVRQGLDPLWRTMPMPRILILNTILLLGSSLLLEKSRRGLDIRWLAASLVLGLIFVCGQLVAWRDLTSRGVYFATTAHSSFFYLLTATHGLHVAGGLLALSWGTVISAARRERYLAIASLYWHFMGILWLYILYLLFGMR